MPYGTFTRLWAVSKKSKGDNSGLAIKSLPLTLRNGVLLQILSPFSGLVVKYSSSSGEIELSLL